MLYITFQYLAIRQNRPITSFLLMYGNQTENIIWKILLCRTGHLYGIAFYHLDISTNVMN